MIIIWSVTYDTHMIRYTYNTHGSHMKGNSCENHVARLPIYNDVDLSQVKAL